jgi:hypothetical protein
MKTIKSESLVHARHRAARWAPMLGLVAAGLALTLGLLWRAHPSFAPVANWQHLGAGWLVGLVATGVCAAALWRARRRTLVRSAAELDTAWDAHNRLETAVALHDVENALAKAQRDETEQFLQQSPAVARSRWLPVSVVLVALLIMAHVATLVCWARSTQPAAKAAKNVPQVVADKKAEPAAPTASIEWRSPESETAATAIEEVPLTADADSSTGLSDAVLEIEVNGAHRLTQQLSDNLASPGPHTLKPSIYLDQLDVKTYDIVSYHVSARRLGDDSLPATVSPVQFVEVKPMREDTFICAGGDQPSKCFNYVTALKAAQLRLMKDNFTLAHADVSHNDSEWLNQNSRVGNDQNQLAGRADDVITMMATNHYPEQILGLVRQSQPLMMDAGGKITRQENQPALTPQGQALADLTEVEKYLQNSIKLAGQSTQPKAKDPFERPKNLELKTHPLTRAGKIDALAKAQAGLAGDLAAGNTNATVKTDADKSPSADISGTPGERQEQIRKQIADFLEDPGVTADAMKHLQQSDTFSGESQERINQAEFSAASEPAAQAARELRETAAALRSGGNQAAQNKLADALLQLSAAANNARRATQAKSDAEAAAELKKTENALQEAARQLAAEAQRQQENGATNAAARLNDMAKMLSGESMKQTLAQAEAAPRDAAKNEALAQKLDNLAEEAARQRNPGPVSRQELARLVDRLQRTQANLNNLASQCKNPGQSQGQGQSASASGKPSESSQAAGPGLAHARTPEASREDMKRQEGEQLLDELRLGTMDAQWVGAEMTYVKKLQHVLDSTAEQPGGVPDGYAPLVLQIDPLLTGVINSLQTKLTGMRRQFDLAEKDPAAAPPAYREAVADYFERVSRDYQRPANQSDDAR